MYLIEWDSIYFHDILNSFEFERTLNKNYRLFPQDIDTFVDSAIIETK